MDPFCWNEIHFNKMECSHNSILNPEDGAFYSCYQCGHRLIYNGTRLVKLETYIRDINARFDSIMRNIENIQRDMRAFLDIRPIPPPGGGD